MFFVLPFFFDCNVPYSICFYLFLKKLRRPVLFSSSWLLLIVIDKFANKNSCFGYCFRRLAKFPRERLLEKLSSANMRFVNCFILKFSTDFQNTEELYRGCFTKVVVQHYLNLINLSSSSSKLESITCKFTKNRTPSIHCKCRTAILKNASWWLLLRTTLFWKYSWTATFQRQLQSIFILKFLDYTYFTFLT